MAQGQPRQIITSLVDCHFFALDAEFFEHMLRTGHCMLPSQNAAGKRQGKTHLETIYSITSPKYLSKGALDPPNQLLAKKSGSSQ
jgi:hypothetical protein